MRRHPFKAARLLDRMQEALREIGVLLMAFAPLEAPLSRGSTRFLLLYLSVGFVLFVLALALEWRRANDQ